MTVFSSFVAVTLGVAACTAGPGHVAKPAGFRRSATSTTSADAAVRSAVLSAWTAAEQTLYVYLQVPWQQVRPGIASGASGLQLWPKLPQYFSGAALESEVRFLAAAKLGQLSGPTSYNLGKPVVTALSGNSATVTGCIFDTGTTSLDGQPGPRILDGGGPGGGRGSWTMSQNHESWTISGYTTASVPKC